MKQVKVIVEVRRGMVECVYSSVADAQVLVLDHDAQEQGYGDTDLEQVDVRPLSELNM
jgi:hypothetical protein